MQLLLRVHIDTMTSDHDWADISLYANDRDVKVMPVRLPEGATAAEAVATAMLEYIRVLTEGFQLQFTLES